MEAAALAKKEAEARAKKEAAEKAVLVAARKAAEQAALNQKGVAAKIAAYEAQLADLPETGAKAERFEIEGILTTLRADKAAKDAETKALEAAQKALAVKKQQEAAATQAANLKAEKAAIAAKAKAEAEAAAKAKVQREADEATAKAARVAARAAEKAAKADAMAQFERIQAELEMADNEEDAMMWLDALGAIAETLFGAEEAEARAAAYEVEENERLAAEAQLDADRLAREEAAAAKKLKQQAAGIAGLEASVKATNARVAELEAILDADWYPQLEDGSADSWTDA